MLDLSPAKLLVVFIVAMILLGPSKLPQVARQLGAAWRQLRTFHDRVDAEVRKSMPDLPSTQDIARIARSPVALLNKLAEMPSGDPDQLVADPGATEADPADGAWPSDPTAPDPDPGWVDPTSAPFNGLDGDHDRATGRGGAERQPGTPAGAIAVPDDPSMN
ncbi:MAG: twin-arginine translocase TatA/TatE family subunit [Acidimicrobiales bacterium]